MYTVISTTGDRTRELIWRHLCATYGNTGHLFRPYKVSPAMYTVISTTGDRTRELIWRHLRATYGNTGHLFRPYKVSPAMYTVISTTGDRTRELIWRHLRVIWTVGSVEEFRLCNLWSLVRSPVMAITV